MGTARAPVEGSGFCPPCRAMVSKPGFLSKVVSLKERWALHRLQQGASIQLEIKGPRKSIGSRRQRSPPVGIERGQEASSRLRHRRRFVEELFFELVELGPDQSAFRYPSLERGNRLQTVAGDDEHGGLLRIQPALASQLARNRHGHAARRLGEDAFGFA